MTGYRLPMTLACHSLALVLLLSTSWLPQAHAWHSLRNGGRCQQSGGSCRTTIGNAGGQGACCDPRSSNIATCATQNSCQGGSHYRWTTMPVKWHFNPNNMAGQSGYAGKAESAIETTLKKAWDAWTQPPCSGFAHSYAGKTSAKSDVNDRKLVCFLPSPSQWAGMGLPSSVLAVARPVASSDGSLRDADISYNPSPSGRKWGMLPTVASGEMDFADVSAHEIGHALGFGHTHPKNSLMYYSVRGVGPLFNGLTQDEIDGVCTVYPATSCTSNAQCGTCRACNNGTCGPKNLSTQPKTCKGCSTDADCSGQTCASISSQYRCLQACDNEGCCPDGYTCATIGGKQLCKPSSDACPALACSSDADCGKNEKCQSSKCQKTCQNDSDCPTGFVCRSQSCQQAAPGKQGDPCSANAPCSSGLSCLDGSSGKICTTRCGSGTGTYASNAPGARCSGSCAESSQCTSISSSLSICFHPCSSTNPCPNGGFCASLNGKRVCLCRDDTECKQSAGYGCNRGVFSNLGACASRGTSQCPSGFSCTANSQGEKVCQSGSSSSCGNGTCDASENCTTCAQDCKCPSGETCNAGACQPATGKDCGNGTCDATEDCSSCAKDCACPSGFSCNKGACQSAQGCGNGTCDATEDCNSCAKDCLCPSGYVCQSNGSCDLANSANCGNGTCDSDETCSSCAKDCACPSGQVCNAGTCQAPSKNCGNGSCDTDETCTTCPTDCQCPSDLTCQDGVCQQGSTPPDRPASNPDQSGNPDQNANPGVGNVGGPCYPNNTCNGSAQCFQNGTSSVCLAPANNNNNTNKAVGTVGGPCYPNNTCNGNAQCFQNGGSSVCLEPANTPQPKGCGCQSTPTPTSFGLFLLLLLLITRKTRSPQP